MGSQGHSGCKIPIPVNQDDVLFYTPEHPFRNRLGQGVSVSRIDVRLTDRDGNIIDFNGVPNELLIVFEIYDVVDIPLMRHNEHAVKDPNARTIVGAQMPQIYNFSGRGADYTTGGHTQIDYAQRENERKKDARRANI